MAKFRKKPVVIEAIQWTGMNDEEMAEFMTGNKQLSIAFDDGSVMIGTLEGQMKAMPDDWIIRGVKGEFYPCKPDIFEATYEAVQDD